MGLNIQANQPQINFSEGQLVEGPQGEIVLVNSGTYNDSVDPKTFEGTVLHHPSAPGLQTKTQTYNAAEFDLALGVEIVLSQS